MTTPIPLGEISSVTQDENTQPTTSSPKKSIDTLPSPTNSKSNNLRIDTTGDPRGAVRRRAEIGYSPDSRDDNTTTNASSSLVFSGGSTSDDNFSIDRYNTAGSLTDKGSSSIVGDGLSIETTDSDQLERMMAKFDDAQAPTFEEEEEPAAATATAETTTEAAAMVSETPRALNQMMEKFEMLHSSSNDEPHQNKMMTTFDRLQNPTIATHRMDGDDDLQEKAEVQQSNEQYAPNDHENDPAFASYSNSNSYSSNEMFADIEQFRSAESHFGHSPPISPEHAVAMAAAASSASASAGASGVPPSTDTATTTSTAPVIDSQTQKILEQRIVSLVNQVSELEIEKDELRTQKDDLQSQLTVQQDQEVENMYQNPYSDSLATPTKAASGMPSFLESATASIVGISSSTLDNNGTELHREMTELRLKNKTLQEDLASSDRVKDRLKKILKTVQAEDKQKMDLVAKIKQELHESKEKEGMLKNELDACKVRLKGFAIAQKQQQNQHAGSEKDDDETSESNQPSSPLRSRSAKSSSDARKSFFNKKSPKHQQLQTGDVATALVVSQKQNEALEAFNKELELQNTNLQQKCDSLNEKYGLKAPSSSTGDDKSIQMYSRYIEMKSELSSLSVVLDETKESNSKLTEKVQELEIELSESQQHHAKPNNNSGVAIASMKSIFAESSGAINPEQEDALNDLVGKLEDQILGYREAEKRHGELEVVLTSTQAELQTEQAKLRLLETKHKALRKIAAGDSSNDAMTKQLLQENEMLLDSVSALQEQTQQLQKDLEQKATKIEKSEKRVASKHEQAVQLNQANASLREGIQKLKVHLSIVTEQASKSEGTLAITKQELDVERETKQKLEVAHGTLETKIMVLQQSIDGNTDEDSSKKIELIASLAASRKELSLEKERATKLAGAKKELEVTLDTTKKDLQTQLHTQTQNNSELEMEISTMKEELKSTKLLVAAATNKMAEFDESSLKETKQLQDLLENRNELLSAEKDKVERLKTLKSSLESKLDTTKQRFVDLQNTDGALKEELEALKEKGTANDSHQFGELEKLLATTQDELNEEEQRVESLETQVDDLTMQIQELEKCKSDLEVSLDDVKQELQNMTAENIELQSMLKAATEKDNAVEDANASDASKTFDRNNSTASTDVRLWEADMLLGNTRRDLKDALKENKELAGKVDNLESSLEKSQQTNTQTLKECETHEQINKEMTKKIESFEIQLQTLLEDKQSLQKRMASLARRDQLQKASLMTSNDEIAKLTKTVSGFQSRFETLAKQVEEGEAKKNAQMNEYKDHEVKWIAEKIELNDRIMELQKNFNVIKKRYDALDSKHVQALMMEQTSWQTERVSLNKRIAVLGKNDDSAAAYPIQTCGTDRSLLNQKMCELEQDINLLEVTIDDKKQQHIAATAELEETTYRLEACEEELESCKAEMQTLVLKSATDREAFHGKIRELEEELESTAATLEATKKERDSVTSDYGVTQTILDASKAELQRYQKKHEDSEAAAEKETEVRSKREAKDMESFKTSLQELQSKYDSCLKELDSCKMELAEKEAVMRELAKKQVEQRERNKQALELLTNDLDEALTREKATEDELCSCEKELFDCKLRIESFESKVMEEQFGTGVYKDVVHKLKRSNRVLTTNNIKLQEEAKALKESAAAMQRSVNSLRQENKISRVMAGNSGGEVERENHMMKDLLATSQLSVTEAKNMQKILSNQVEAASKRETKLAKELLAMKGRNADMEQRLEEQEQELDEFESDFALARNDARKVVEELRSQLVQIEERNKQLESVSGGFTSIEDIKGRLNQLVQKNKRLQKEINNCKARELWLENELGLATASLD
jgi:chromosome segregation ATPase